MLACAQICTQICLLSTHSKKFFRCAGLTRWRPAAQGTFWRGGARAKVAGKVCSRRIDAARRAGLENQGAVRQRCRQHTRKTGKKKDPTQAGTQRTAWRLSANVRPCFGVSWNVYVRVCGCLDLRVFGFGCLGNRYSKLCVLTVEIRHFRFAGRCPE